MPPLVAIIGRPNVGKSSLFNRLARRRIAIVDPTPGVTRDRLTTPIEVQPPEDAPESARPRLIELADTGGYGVYTADGRRLDDAGTDLSPLSGEVESQIMAAVAEARVVLFVIDAQQGLTALDRSIAKILRKAGAVDRTICLANKVDDHSWEPAAHAGGALGFGDVMPVSANSALGLRALLAEIWTRVEADEAPPANAEMKVAIVGRRNAGKSSLVNALAGQERVIVSEIAGTTRDAVDVRFELEGRAFVAIDTAGVRKRKAWADDVEYYSNDRTSAAIARADVCVLLLDSVERVSQVEKHLAGQLTEAFKPTVIALNKWDLLSASARGQEFLKYLTQELPELSYAPVVCVSALRNEGLSELVHMAFNLHTQAGHREGTGRLNSTVRTILEDRGPSSKLGTRAKIYYISQIAVHPPTIAMVVNDPELFEGAYERYLVNRLRDELPFSEVPIRLLFRARKQTEKGAVTPRGSGRSSPEAPEDSSD